LTRDIRAKETHHRVNLLVSNASLKPHPSLSRLFSPRKNHHPRRDFFSAAAQNVVPRKEDHTTRRQSDARDATIE